MQTISPLWQRFTQEDVLATIPQRLNKRHGCSGGSQGKLRPAQTEKLKAL